MFNKMFNLVNREELIKLLEYRDNIIKNRIDYIEREINKNNHTLEQKIKNLKEKEEEKIYHQDEIEKKYCYKIEHNGEISVWENPELFKEWFKKEIFQKETFKANDKAWAVITEILKEDTDAKMAEENNS